MYDFIWSRFFLLSSVLSLWCFNITYHSKLTPIHRDAIWFALYLKCFWMVSDEFFSLSPSLFMHLRYVVQVYLFLCIYDMWFRLNLAETSMQRCIYTAHLTKKKTLTHHPAERRWYRVGVKKCIIAAKTIAGKCMQIWWVCQLHPPQAIMAQNKWLFSLSLRTATSRVSLSTFSPGEPGFIVLWCVFFSLADFYPLNMFIFANSCHYTRARHIHTYSVLLLPVWHGYLVAAGYKLSIRVIV